VATWNVVRRSTYHDSVTLMRLTRDLEAIPGVTRVAAMMGTPQNRDLLREAGLLDAQGDRAGPSDLIIAVRADSVDVAQSVLTAAESALSTRRPAAWAAAVPRRRSLAAALDVLPDATLALVSVPGAHAATEVRRALDAGLHVMCFSDNVPVPDEVRLKTLARQRNLFLMGPDCGTAIIGGVPLGFANVVPRGRIGVAAASGTGLQELVCLVTAAGEGVSHAIGVGGRDLSDDVGGLMMEAALDALAADPATAVVAAIGKPPGPATLATLRAHLGRLGKPVVVHFTGDRTLSTAATLEDAAQAAVALVRRQTPAPVEFTAPRREIAALVESASGAMSREQRWVRALYAGGTLAWEAREILASMLPDVAPGLSGHGQGHAVVDLGADLFTVGRPHPMIDGTVRRAWIEKEAADPTTAVLLLDIVLGCGAHPDPVGEILSAVCAGRRRADTEGRSLTVVASVCGTEADPQRRSAQVQMLEAAEVLVMPSNAQAARLAASIAAARAL